ncbi:hypothetical protein [Actinokineospora sp. HUAS TT18]|uniref:hypothetical protein n=1 Tax=Actinokineospora sp. HUAS TT18 TaxID=3447451 RepID=UPI003F525E50
MTREPAALDAALRSFFAAPPDDPAALAAALDGIPKHQIRRALNPWPGFNREWARHTGQWLIRHGANDCAVRLGLSLLGATGTTEDAGLIRTTACERRFTRPAINACSPPPARTPVRSSTGTAGRRAPDRLLRSPSTQLGTLARFAAVASLVEDLTSGSSALLDWADGQRERIITRLRELLGSIPWQKALREARSAQFPADEYAETRPDPGQLQLHRRVVSTVPVADRPPTPSPWPRPETAVVTRG